MATFTHWNKKEKIHSEIGFENEDDHLYVFQVRNPSDTPFKLQGPQGARHNARTAFQLLVHILQRSSNCLTVTICWSQSSKAENPHEATLTLHQWAQSALREQLMKACLFALSQNPPVRSHYIFQTQIQLKKIIYTMLLKSVINVRKVISCSAAEC